MQDDYGMTVLLTTRYTQAPESKRGPPHWDTSGLGGHAGGGCCMSTPPEQWT